jgi:hypothetical protein
MYKNKQQIISGAVCVVSTVLIGYVIWSFYGNRKGGATAVTEKA